MSTKQAVVHPYNYCQSDLLIIIEADFKSHYPRWIIYNFKIEFALQIDISDT